MTIQSFQFEDKAREWRLERVQFRAFNLLVGMSGVGKTLILDSLRRVRNAALRGPRRVPGCAWTMEIEVESRRYTWSAETSLPSAPLSAFDMDDDALDGSEEIDTSSEEVFFVEESITLEDGSVLFKRSGDDLMLNGQPMPSLKKTESLISTTVGFSSPARSPRIEIRGSTSKVRFADWRHDDLQPARKAQSERTSFVEPGVLTPGESSIHKIQQ